MIAVRNAAELPAGSASSQSGYYQSSTLAPGASVPGRTDGGGSALLGDGHSTCPVEIAVVVIDGSFAFAECVACDWVGEARYFWRKGDEGDGAEADADEHNDEFHHQS